MQTTYIDQQTVDLRRAAKLRTAALQEQRDMLLQRRAEGATYKELGNLVGYSYSSIRALLLPEVKIQKKHARRSWTTRAKQESPIMFWVKKRMGDFFRLRIKGERGEKRMTLIEKPFTLDELLDKITNNPVCYLSGAPIDLLDHTMWAFDHILPRCKGGDCSLNNLGLCLASLNAIKSDKTLDEFHTLITMVYNHKRKQFGMDEKTILKIVA